MKRFLLFLLLFSVSSFAQQRMATNASISINFPEFTIKTEVLNIKKKIIPNQNLIYSWYAYNKIFETKGGFDGRVLNGNYTSFYLSGSLREKGSYKYGLKTGEWIIWYENGQIKEVINWKNGIQNGKYKSFDEKGSLLAESDYKNGLLNGCKATYSEGKVIECKKYCKGKEVVTSEKGKTKNDTKAEKPVNTEKSKEQPKAEKKSLNEKTTTLFKRKHKASKSDSKPINAK